jgi:hypothetical protein
MHLITLPRDCKANTCFANDSEDKELRFLIRRTQTVTVHLHIIAHSGQFAISFNGHSTGQQLVPAMDNDKPPGESTDVVYTVFALGTDTGNFRSPK